jgi:hypothetical protein
MREPPSGKVKPNVTGGRKLRMFYLSWTSMNGQSRIAAQTKPDAAGPAGPYGV